jgi:hypothetical protein
VKKETPKPAATPAKKATPENTAAKKQPVSRIAKAATAPKQVMPK